MKIFLDSAITTDIQDRLSTEIIDGVTTNPTLIKKSGEDPDVVYKELYDMRVKDISIEVRGETAQELSANGILYGRKYGEVATIKLPCTVEGLKACKKLSILGYKTNMTLIFCTSQAILCSLAGATYVSPFVGRLDQIGDDGIQLIRDIAKVFCIHKRDTQILAASLRSAQSAAKAYAAGAHICTLPINVFDDMYKHDLTRAGLKQFALDFGANV
jgi:transaldolase|tara:strand:- start:109 stop:753 length:645 start_codon:yes stop_codon:yes gene_type:complete